MDSLEINKLINMSPLRQVPGAFERIEVSDTLPCVGYGEAPLFVDVIVY